MPVLTRSFALPFHVDACVQVPRFWLVGYDEGRHPLAPDQVCEHPLAPDQGMLAMHTCLCCHAWYRVLGCMQGPHPMAPKSAAAASL